MASFTSDELSIATATATKVADAVDVPREILMRDSTQDVFRLAFTSADAANGAKITSLGDSGNGALRFTVPPCTEVWVYQASGSNKTLYVIVAGR